MELAQGAGLDARISAPVMVVEIGNSRSDTRRIVPSG